MLFDMPPGTILCVYPRGIQYSQDHACDSIMPNIESWPGILLLLRAAENKTNERNNSPKPKRDCPCLSSLWRPSVCECGPALEAHTIVVTLQPRQKEEKKVAKRRNRALYAQKETKGKHKSHSQSIETLMGLCRNPELSKPKMMPIWFWEETTTNKRKKEG